ncbi:MAG: phosphoribosylformylglycinamidine cyclo-ligase, partial [Clostridia bacterium]|nr:phosphoribosylformylglycinamidine cyclo-ligase [Clostridia bacterium]
SIPDGLSAVVEKSSLRILPIFDLIKERGGISERDMFNTFNMGVGMTVTVAESDAGEALRILREAGEDAYVVGRIEKGEEKVVIC